MLFDDLYDGIKNERHDITLEQINKFLNKGRVLKDMLKLSLRDVVPVNFDDVKNKYYKFCDGNNFLFSVKIGNKYFLLVLHEVSSSKILLKNSEAPEVQRVLKRVNILLTTIKYLLNSLAFSDDNEVKEFNINSCKGKFLQLKIYCKISIHNCYFIKEKSTQPLSDITNKKTDFDQPEILVTPFLDHIINKGKQILKDRSVLYKTPVKVHTHNLPLHQTVSVTKKKCK